MEQHACLWKVDISFPFTVVKTEQLLGTRGVVCPQIRPGLELTDCSHELVCPLFISVIKITNPHIVISMFGCPISKTRRLNLMNVCNDSFLLDITCVKIFYGVFSQLTYALPSQSAYQNPSEPHNVP